MAGQKYETPLAGGVSQEPKQKTDGAIICRAAAVDKAFATLRAFYVQIGGRHGAQA